MNSVIALLFLLFHFVHNFPDQGQSSETRTQVDNAIFGVPKPLYADSGIYATVTCESRSSHQKIELQWVLRQTSCYEDYLASDIYDRQVLNHYFLCPMSTSYFPSIRYFVAKPIVLECSNRIHLDFVNATFTTFTDKVPVPSECQNDGNIFGSVPDSEPLKPIDLANVSDTSVSNGSSSHSRKKRNLDIQSNKNKKSSGVNIIKAQTSFLKPTEISTSAGEHISSSLKETNKKIESEKVVNNVQGHNNETSGENSYGYMSKPLSTISNVKLGAELTTVDKKGIFLFILKVKSLDQSIFNISVDVGMKGQHGYLSAVDYPLLIFYGVMCGIYVVYAVGWLIVSALQWRDLLRIQFWIGGVILLGLMEKAVFYAEYQSINYTGKSVQGAILFAEILSCMKRTLARMLIIIVSLGFGIVKPRLGPMLHRVVGVGVLYFILSTIEGCLRVLKPKTDPGNQVLMAGIPLAITDSAICWWIFSSLVQTIRTLRLRGNIVKLQLYRRFTNLLLLSIICSVSFMIWSIHNHKLVNCIADWNNLWLDEAYWHFLFSIMLFTIMILWIPTNNNRRYAFTPLLDAIDEDDDEDENQLTNDAFDGMKMRVTKNNINSPKEEDSKKDDDLKWVEENIPTSLSEAALPSLLDSDEEIMTAKYERSKME